MRSRQVSVFGSSMVSEDDFWYQQAVRLGRLLGRDGFQVFTGGYGGIMQAVGQGVTQAGGEMVGVTLPAAFPHRSGANPHVGTEIPARSLSERLEHLVTASEAVVVFPGSVGTITELLLSINHNHLFSSGRSSGFPWPSKLIVTIGEEWRPLLELLVSQYEFNPQLFTQAESVEEAYQLLCEFAPNSPC